MISLLDKQNVNSQQISRSLFYVTCLQKGRKTIIKKKKMAQAEVAGRSDD
jgi:hypothetical protein